MGTAIILHICKAVLSRKLHKSRPTLYGILGKTRDYGYLWKKQILLLLMSIVTSLHASGHIVFSLLKDITLALFFESKSALPNISEPLSNAIQKDTCQNTVRTLMIRKMLSEKLCKYSSSVSHFSFIGCTIFIPA